MDTRWPSKGPTRGRIVLLHGLNALAQTWWRVGPDLAERGWDVTALDLPGHGDQPPLTRPLAVDELADGVVHRLDGPVDVLLGHSLGAVVALAVALRRPASFGGLVLEEPSGREAMTPAERETFADRLLADAALARRDRRALEQRDRTTNPTWAPADVTHAVDGVLRADAEHLAAALRRGWGWNLSGLFESLRHRRDVPVLVLAAPEGRTALQGVHRQTVRAQVPPERFVILDGNHCLHRDLPEEWVAHVDRFAAETAGRSRILAGRSDP
ncbi:MAG TPA: alpha/beta hydrolase [Actinopolymorphaceae bacterium]